MIYIMLLASNVSLTACRSIKQMPNSYVDSIGSQHVPATKPVPYLFSPLRQATYLRINFLEHFELLFLGFEERFDLFFE